MQAQWTLPSIRKTGNHKGSGRLAHSELSLHTKHPLIINRKHPLATTIVMHFHAMTMHQGEKITHGRLRELRRISYRPCSHPCERNDKNCVICKKLRREFATQFMADLPLIRLEETLPFQSVGIDAFGPFMVYDGKCTRRNNASKKDLGSYFHVSLSSNTLIGSIWIKHSKFSPLSVSFL